MDSDFTMIFLVLETLLVIAIISYFYLSRKSVKTDNDKGKHNHTQDMPSVSQAFNLIRNRRTITPKDYKPGGKISDEDMRTILEAANWAPTHNKTQPWRYVVLSGPEAIRRYLDFLSEWYADRSDSLPEEALSKFRSKYESVSVTWPAKVCHAALIVMRRQALPDKRMPEWEEMCATACSVQNMHLMATAMRLGAFWSSHTWCKDARDSDEMKDYLNMDLEDKLLGAFVFGEIEESQKFKSTRRPILDSVEFRAD